MKVIKASYEILTPISEGGIEELKRIEQAARTCYKSEGLITEDGESAKKLIKMLVERSHEAMLEHSSITIKFICSRAISHELVRHRLAAWAQESQRYVNYSKNKYNSEITVIEPLSFSKNSQKYIDWKRACREAETAYFNLLADGCTPQEAREVLPNSTKTEVVMTCNYRELRHFLKLRTDVAAHPYMREITRPLLDELKSRIPIIFDDIEYAQG